MHNPILYTVILLLLGFPAESQRVNFKPFVQSENLSVTILENPLGLNFNQKQGIIVAGDPAPVTVNITESQTVVVGIEAPLDYDLTIEFNSSGRLSIGNLDTGITVPFQLRFAYNNTGETNDITRRMSAVEVPSGYNVVTLPVRRKIAGGPPGPPPTPEHEGYERPRGTVYLYIYGSLGPAQADAPAGNYSGTVDININYADNAF